MTDEIITDESLERELNSLEGEAGADPEILAAQEAQELTDQANQAVAFQGQAEYQELINGVLAPGLGLLAPNWNIQPQEVEALAQAYAPLLQKYFPDGPSQFGPEISAVMVTLAVFGPRYKLPRKLEAEPGEGGDA